MGFYLEVQMVQLVECVHVELKDRVCQIRIVHVHTKVCLAHFT